MSESTSDEVRRSAYEVLGVPVDASADDIRKAYRRRVQQVHPDRFATSHPMVRDRAQLAFVELTRAYGIALAVSEAPAAPAARVEPVVVAQRRPVDAPQNVRPITGDPMLLLLTLPRRAGEGWTTDSLKLWALTMVPAARRHLAEAHRLAVAAGAVGSFQVDRATVHALLTMTLRGRMARRCASLAAHVDAAYQWLELDLPPQVAAALPARAALAR